MKGLPLSGHVPDHFNAAVSKYKIKKISNVVGHKGTSSSQLTEKMSFRGNITDSWLISYKIIILH